MTVEMISNERELFLLGPEWDALWSSVESPCYFQSFSYIRACWQEMYKGGHTALHCIVIRDSGKVVLIWPLIVTRTAMLRVLKPLNAGAAEYTQPLVQEGPEAIGICSLAWSSARSRIKADIISIPLVKAGYCLHDVLSRERAFKVEKDLYYTQKGGATWKDWDSYYKTISAGHSLRSERRRRRLLGEHGTIKFETLEGTADSAAAIDWCLRHKREWAERVNKRGAWLYSEKFRNLLVALFADDNSAQRGIIFLLTLNGSPIASKIAIYNKVKVEGILSCFDARWAKYSPGAFLDEAIARWIVERSLEVDFGVGTEAYKKFWSNNNAAAVDSHHFAGNWMGWLALKARQWLRARRERASPSKDERGRSATSEDAETV